MPREEYRLIRKHANVLMASLLSVLPLFSVKQLFMVTLSIQIDNQLCPKSGKQTEIQSANE